MAHHLHDLFDAAPPNEQPAHRVARATGRVVPWVMGVLSAGMRGSGGIHPSQFKLLMSVHHGGMTPSDLADRMQVSLPTVSKMVSGLERRGWIERAADPADRRRTVLTLTAEGRDAVIGFMLSGVDQLAEVLASASPDELARIEAGMDALRDTLVRARPERHCPRDHHHATEGDAR